MVKHIMNSKLLLLLQQWGNSRKQLLLSLIKMVTNENGNIPERARSEPENLLT